MTKTYFFYSCKKKQKSLKCSLTHTKQHLGIKIHLVVNMSPTYVLGLCLPVCAYLCLFCVVLPWFRLLVTALIWYRRHFQASHLGLGAITVGLYGHIPQKHCIDFPPVSYYYLSVCHTLTVFPPSFCFSFFRYYFSLSLSLSHPLSFSLFLLNPVLRSPVCQQRVLVK